jgi:glucose/arabinose dehydrogenase
VVREERLFTDLGRIREVAVGPDGALYFSTSNRDGRGDPAREDDRIFRLAP